MRSLPKKASAKGQPALKALVVEDNIILQKVHKGMLEHLRYSLEVAGTGIEALILLEVHHYDLILMEIRLPDMTGLEVAKAFRQSQLLATKATKIIGVTAYLSDEIKSNCLEAGCDLVLNKPIGLKELQAHLQRLFLPAAK